MDPEDYVDVDAAYEDRYALDDNLSPELEDWDEPDVDEDWDEPDVDEAQEWEDYDPDC